MQQPQLTLHRRPPPAARLSQRPWRKDKGTDQLASARIAVATMASASAGVNSPWPVIIRYTAGAKMRSRVNLARCAMWFMSLGKFDTDVPGTGEQNQLLAPDTITAQTPYGEYVRLAPPVQFSETKPYWRDPVLVVRGSSKPAWTTA